MSVFSKQCKTLAIKLLYKSQIKGNSSSDLVGHPLGAHTQAQPTAETGRVCHCSSRTSSKTGPMVMFTKQLWWSNANDDHHLIPMLFYKSWISYFPTLLEKGGQPSAADYSPLSPSNPPHLITVWEPNWKLQRIDLKPSSYAPVVMVWQIILLYLLPDC